jgi:hypothetical protein
MKNAREHGTRRGIMLQQVRREATGIKQLHGGQHSAPAPSAVMPEHGRLSYALVAVLSLALLLFSLLGMLAAITGAHALIANRLSVSSAATRPTKTPPPRHAPTPTTVPSPTLTAPPTMIATVPARATPPVQATTPPVVRQPGGSQRRRPLSTLPTSTTSSPAVHQLSRVQRQGEGAFFPLVLGILTGIAAVGLLVAVGRWLLRKWLLPLRKVKVPPSGAPPWQRVRPTSLQSSMDSAGYNRQHLPTTDAFIPAASITLPSRLSTTSQGVPKWQARPSTRHRLRPTRLKAIHTSGTPAAVKSSSSILPRQNGQPMAPMRERESAKNAEEML